MPAVKRTIRQYQIDTETAENVTEVVTGDPNYQCDLPNNLKYGGEEISILYNPSSGREDELTSEEMGHGVVSDAVYERNVAVEGMLDVVLNYCKAEDIVTDMSQDIQSGSGDYQIFTSLDFDFSSSWSDILGTSNIRSALRPLLSGSKNTVGSMTKSWQRSVQRVLDGYNEQLAGYGT